MTRKSLDETVQEWKETGLIFDEHAFVTASVLPDEPKSAGLHGVLRTEQSERGMRDRLKEALLIAGKHDLFLFAAIGLDESKCFWGGEPKLVYLLPDEAEIALLPIEVVQEIALKSGQLQSVLSESFSYYQEYETAVNLVEKLRLIEEQLKSFMWNARFQVPLRSSTKKTRELLREIEAGGRKLEKSLREQLDEPLQHEAATTICEGIRFLHAFR